MSNINEKHQKVLLIWLYKLECKHSDLYENSKYVTSRSHPWIGIILSKTLETNKQKQKQKQKQKKQKQKKKKKQQQIFISYNLLGAFKVKHCRSAFQEVNYPLYQTLYLEYCSPYEKHKNQHPRPVQERKRH